MPGPGPAACAALLGAATGVILRSPALTACVIVLWSYAVEPFISTLSYGIYMYLPGGAGSRWSATCQCITASHRRWPAAALAHFQPLIPTPNDSTMLPVRRYLLRTDVEANWFPFLIQDPAAGNLLAMADMPPLDETQHTPLP